jgi:predicted trehalose synthase
MSISTYVPGRLLASRVSWMRRTTLGATLREILEQMETISQHAPVIDPEEDPYVDLAAKAAWAFDAIPSSLLAPEQAAVLRATVAAAGRLRRVPQHGDLWPMNVLRYDGRWLLLDFEIFGRIQVPLYDAFHLVRSCWAMRQGWLQRTVHRLRSPTTSTTAPNWVACLRSSASDPYRQTLAWARARHGLTNTDAVGALAFYMVDVAARIYLRRVRMEYVEPYLSDLCVLADTLAAGETFADAFRQIPHPPASLQPAH